MATGTSSKMKLSPEEFARMFSNFKECPEPAEAEIIGEVPKWLTGTLLRLGPGIFKIGDDTYNHLFDGLALIQRFQIKNGKVWCNTKFLRSDTYKRNMAANRIVCSEFGTMKHPDPCKTLFDRYFSYFFDSTTTDNDVVNFIECGDEVYASSETPGVNFVNPISLDTVRQENWKQIVGVNTMTAHAHYDRAGNIYNLGSANTDYVVVKVPNPRHSKKPGLSGTEIIARIPIAHKTYQSYYHSFGLSENYSILFEMPLLLNLLKMLAVSFGVSSAKSFSAALEWFPECKPILHVNSLKTGQPSRLKYTGRDPFFTFHHINAFEEKDCVIVDFVKYRDGGAIMKNLSIKEFQTWVTKMGGLDNKPYACRFILPLTIPENASIGDDLLKLMGWATDAKAVLQSDGSIECVDELLVDVSYEFPRINYARNNQRNYQYCYGSGTSPDHAFGSKVLKVDFVNKKFEELCMKERSMMVGEPVFIARPGAEAEDDGVVLAPVTNIRESAKDFLLVLDASSWTEIARAVVEPRLPFSFHAHYLDDM